MSQSYTNFQSALYCTVKDVLHMQDEQWRNHGLDQIERSLKIDKVYLETFRSMETASREILKRTKNFFLDHNIAVSGSITTSWTTTPDWEFKSLCYTNPEHRDILREICTLTAELFDEIILDDFFFTNCTCERCIAAKGGKNWAELRLNVMAEVAQNLVIAPAKKANPRVRLILKFPNWYEHFSFLGYNLETGINQFDAIYTGTETRDATYSSQHLPPYLSYGLMRYFENVNPGKNNGGWVDPFIRRDLDRYAEQIRLTLFAKAREITLFCFGAIVDWSTEFDDSPTQANWVTPIAGNVLDDCDSFIGELGEPYGIQTYKPLYSCGEDFLHHYFGSLGIPINLQPQFPNADRTVLLTECAKFDPRIVEKIKIHLKNGVPVIITSGLLKALQDKGFKQIADLECTDKKALVNTFSTFSELYRSAVDILIPQISYPTNEASEIITCLKNENGYPLLLRVPYAEGRLYVLTIPETYSDLYHLPKEVLTHLKRIIMRELPLHVESAGRVGLFLYHNNTCIVESFMPHNTLADIVFHHRAVRLHDLKSGAAVNGHARDGETCFPVTLYPHTYRAFRFEYSSQSSA
jgi:hypothetical protein